MAAPNIVNVTSIIGKTAVLAITTSETALVTNAAASNKVLKVNSLIVSNIDGTNVADVTVVLKRSSTNYALASTISVPADSSLVVVSKENTIYLEEGDGIFCLASANGDLRAVCSYEDIS
jgi:hypothetical protein